MVICSDDQHLSFTLQVHNKTMGFSAIYVSTSYIHRKDLWSNFTNRIPNTPWCFIEYYNFIISVDEYNGSKFPAKSPMQYLIQW